MIKSCQCCGNPKLKLYQKGNWFIVKCDRCLNKEQAVSERDVIKIWNDENKGRVSVEK